MGVQLEKAKTANQSVVIFNPIGLRRKTAEGRLQTPVADIVERISKQIEDLVAHIVIAPTFEEFDKMRESFFSAYVQFTEALSHVVLAKMDQAELPGFIEDSFTTLETEVMPEVAAYFGEETYNEVGFSVETLKRAYRWIPFLRSHKPADDLIARDKELACNYNVSSMWANFHLDMLMTAAHGKQTLLPEIIQELLNGLRQSVMVYAYVREALDLRNVSSVHQEVKLDLIWDDEDEALANAD